MATVTQTRIVRPQYHLELASESMPEELVRILNEHPTEDDALSQKIRKWAIAALNVSETSPIDELEPRAIELVDELYRRILVDPIRYRPFQEPVIDREGISWERSLYNSYKANFPLSPFSAKPFSDVRPHPLATKMIQWVRPILPPQLEGAIAHQAPQTLDEFVQDYAVIINSRQSARDLAVASLFARANASLDRVVSSLKQRNALEIETIRLENQAQTAKLKMDLEVVETRHEGERDQLRQENAAITGTLSQTREELGNTKATLTRQQVQIQNLNATVSSLNAQIASMSSGGSHSSFKCSIQ